MFYVGLDVSVARTAVCIMDAAGQVVREQSVASTPEAIAAAIRASGRECNELLTERAGIEKRTRRFLRLVEQDDVAEAAF